MQTMIVHFNPSNARAAKRTTVEISNQTLQNAYSIAVGCKLRQPLAFTTAVNPQNAPLYWTNAIGWDLRKFQIQMVLMRNSACKMLNLIARESFQKKCQKQVTQPTTKQFLTSFKTVSTNISVWLTRNLPF